MDEIVAQGTEEITCQEPKLDDFKSEYTYTGRYYWRCKVDNT